MTVIIKRFKPTRSKLYKIMWSVQTANKVLSQKSTLLIPEGILQQ